MTSKKVLGEMNPQLARLAKAFAKDPRVTSGKMMASYGLKVDGKIFAMQVKGAFVAKLPKERVEALVAERIGKRFEPGPGRAGSALLARLVASSAAIRRSRTHGSQEARIGTLRNPSFAVKSRGFRLAQRLLLAPPPCAQHA